jgi:hypothetical protein
MAHQLVGYIDCDQRVKAIIAAEFRQPISIGAIAAIRKDRARSAAVAKRMTGWREEGPDPYFSQEYARRIELMEAANDRFVRALHKARLYG